MKVYFHEIILKLGSMSSPGWGSVAAALGRSQELSDLVAAEVVAVVHHCVYCYTLWNASESRACAGRRGKRGTEGRSRSRKRQPWPDHLGYLLARAGRCTGPPTHLYLICSSRLVCCRITIPLGSYGKPYNY
jgi:hypothetical protein